MNKKVIIACTKCGSRNYSTNHNQSNQEKVRLELNKFCKTCNTHTPHKQTI
ncbi:50S ribosomal protein L33 [Pradoshia sp. D12]|uniref:50S ribosomal protein L33 n=1 Tax=Bacillaceae TaxID=186817 RepID=UPI000981F905|nr:MULTISPECIES: 50S ribosomal protein L33 [Bacillaceae]QFK69880.1 50S ribosomal protein L33 [Pradoshia sp. D12]TPF70410.1 50S ribosomal protein L33 [Bacillus sp. D12]